MPNSSLRASWKPLAAMGGIFVGLCAAALIVFPDSRTMSLPAVTSRGSYPVDQWAVVSGTFLACASIARTDDIKRIIQSGDEPAWKRAAGAAVLTGECDLMEPGDSVYVLKNDAYMTQVRKRGATRVYWLNPAVLK